MFSGGITCKGWTFMTAGMGVFKGRKDSTKGEKGDFFGGELSLL